MKANKVFERVCNLISEKYLDNGWKYSKSGHWMSKKDKNGQPAQKRRGPRPSDYTDSKGINRINGRSKNNRFEGKHTRGQ